MKLFIIIGCISRIVWSFPPFRQYKGNFFNYFLIMAMVDAVGTFLNWLGYRNSFSVYAVTSAAALLSVIAINKNIRWIPALSFILFTLAAVIFMPLTEVKLLAAGILSVLIYFFIRYMIIYAGKFRRVSFFHILFLIYNLSLIFKLINVALEYQKGMSYFYATTIFDILLGILFCIFREEDKRFALSLRGPEFENSPFQTEIVIREHEEIK